MNEAERERMGKQMAKMGSVLLVLANLMGILAIVHGVLVEGRTPLIAIPILLTVGVISGGMWWISRT